MRRLLRRAEQVLATMVIDIGFVDPIAHRNGRIAPDDLHERFGIFHIPPVFRRHKHRARAKGKRLPDRHACAHAPALDRIRGRKHDPVALLRVSANDKRSFGRILSAAVRHSAAGVERVQIHMQNAHDVPFYAPEHLFAFIIALLHAL